MNPLYRVLVGILLFTSSAASQPRDAYHTTLVGQLDPANDPGGRYSAIWGYVAPDGREYALLGGYLGTHIIDVTAVPPRQVAFIAGQPSGWREMKTYRHYAYIVTEGGGGLQVVDLSRLPGSAGLVLQDQSHFNTAHTISQEGHFIYVHGSNADAGFNGGTIVFDLLPDPERPVFVGAYSDRYVHDAVIYNDTMYAAAIDDGQLDIVYLGPDRRNPRIVTDIIYPGAGTHNADLTSDHRYIMTTDEIGNTGKTLKIWDRADIESIELVADFTAVPDQIIHNVQTKGNLAVVSWYTAGTRIIDISNPREPVEIGFYDTYPGAAYTYAGNWGVYPWFPSGRIIASDMQRGLFVFTFDGATRGSIQGVVRDATTGAPLPGAVVEVPELGRTTTTDSQGRYRFAAAADTLQYHIAVRHYHERSGSLVLTPEGSTLDIELRPIVYVPLTIRAVDAETGAAIELISYRALTPVGGEITQAALQPAPLTLQVPEGEIAQILVGRWGYLPELVTATSGNVEIAMRRGYLDDAELDLGWSTSAPGDDAVDGRWERAIPRATTGPDGREVQPGSDATPGYGQYAFLTGARALGTMPGTSDVDSGATSLTSPPMDLTRYRKPEINLAFWYTRDQYPLPGTANDTLRMFVSSDDGLNWIQVSESFGTDGGWRRLKIPFRDHATPTAASRFRIVAADRDPQSWVEAGLDDFSVIEQGTAWTGRGEEAAPISVRTSDEQIVFSAESQLLSGAHVEMIDQLGRTVRRVPWPTSASPGRIVLSTEDLAPGVYFWRATRGTVLIQSGTVTVW